MTTKHANTGTCQACLTQFTVKGVNLHLTLVKHGYKRPGYGYLIGECRGVGHPPFELSCDFTKKWVKELIEIYLPEQRRRLEDVVSGKHRTFVDQIYDSKTWKYQDILLTEGEPVPQKWIDAHARQFPPVTEPNWQRLRDSSARKLRQLIADIGKDIEWLRGRIAGWKYAPEALGSQNRPVAVSRERAEKDAERAKKLAEKERVAREKAEKAAHRNRKAIADIADLQPKVLRLLGDVKFVTWMRSNPWPNIMFGTPSMDCTIYDFIVGEHGKRTSPMGYQGYQHLENFRSPPSSTMLSERRAGLRQMLDTLSQWRGKSWESA